MTRVQFLHGVLVFLRHGAGLSMPSCGPPVLSTLTFTVFVPVLWVQLLLRPIRDAYRHVFGSIGKYRSTRIEEVYRPIYNDVVGLEADLLTLGEKLTIDHEYPQPLSSLPPDKRRDVGPILKADLEELENEIEDFETLNEVLTAKVIDELESGTIHTDLNLPRSLIESTDTRPKYVFSRTVQERRGEIVADDYLYDYEFVVLFGSLLIDCDSADEFRDRLDTYVETHGLADRVNFERWNGRNDEWIEHLWESKESPVDTLWDVLEEYENQFEAREEQWWRIHGKARDVAQNLEPKLDALTVRAAKRINARKRQLEERWKNSEKTEGEERTGEHSAAAGKSRADSVDEKDERELEFET